MNAKFKSTLAGLAVAMGFVGTGFGLGDPPSQSLAAELAQAQTTPVLVAEHTDEADSRPGRRGALKRHLAMPYVSFAALLPRRES